MIVESVSQLEHLEYLNFAYEQGRHGDEPSPADISGFNPVLSKSSFPGLQKLGMRAPYEKSIKFVANLSPASNLALLQLQPLTVEHPSVIFRIAKAIADACPLLQTLRLRHLISRIRPLHTHPAPTELCISIDTLRPLFKCTQLRYFEITHHYPLNLRSADIEQIATSWPAIRTLFLNGQPLYLGPTDLTLDALVPLALHCPKLSSLAIYLNADRVPTTPDPQLELPLFKSLKTLAFDVSPIQQEDLVAVFLSRICQEVSVIQDVDMTLPGNDDALKLRIDKWKKVKELLPLLTGSRAEERNRLLHLKAEQKKSKAVEQQLRAEVQRLQEKLGKLSPQST
ncbi:hypothetical protein H0H92_001150 [Tricholoma furcatifolium]|nr:hypothetical protein H0H92_001150 [Tricholoma furcatifolium]